MSAKKKAKKKRPKKAAGKKAAGKKKTKKPSPAKRRKKPSKKRPAKRSPPAALPARRTPVGALTRPGVTSKAAEALFPPEEIERLKLVVLTSARREEKIEALRRLAYSPLDVDRKAELFLNRLADRDAEVRVEAAQLLRILGLDPEVAASIRDLELGDEAQRLFAIDRLGRRMAKGDPLDAGAALIAFTWRLREEGTAAVRRPLIERLEAAAPVIARAPERAEELVRLLVTLFATDPMSVAGPGRRLVRGLGAELPFLRRVLWDEYEGTGDRRVRVFVLQLLSSFAGFGEDERLPPAIAEEIAHADEREVGFRLLGDSLAELGDVGAKALVDVFPAARLAQQKYIVRFLGDICRYGKVSKETREEVAKLFLALLSGHQREIQFAVLRTQLPADRGLSAETRTSLAGAFVTHVHLYGFPADVENCEHTIARAGPAAVGPLIERLGPHSPPGERTRAARILGHLAIEECEVSCRADDADGSPTRPGRADDAVRTTRPGRADDVVRTTRPGRVDDAVRTTRRGASPVPGRAAGEAADLREVLLDILRTLQRYSLEPEFPDRTAVFTAMGKVASTPLIPAETVELVARNLMDRREQEGLGHRVLEGLGYIAASPHVMQARAREIEDLFRHQLTVELPDLSTDEGEEEGVAVFTIGEEARLYTDAVPAAVMGLAHIALGRGASPERTEEIVDFLLGRWEKVTANELDWGPPGSGALVDALREIASSARVDVRHKLRIVRALARRAGHLSAIEALGVIFASEDKSPDLGRLAAAVGVGLLRRRVDGEFRDDERETALRALGRIALRGTLDVATDLTKRLREDVVEELLAGIGDAVPGAYETLARMRSRENLPEKLREDISRKLAAYESLTLA